MKTLCTLLLLFFAFTTSFSSTVTLHIDSVNQQRHELNMQGCDTLVVVVTAGFFPKFCFDTLSNGMASFVFQLNPDYISPTTDTFKCYYLSSATKLFLANVSGAVYYSIKFLPCGTSLCSAAIQLQNVNLSYDFKCVYITADSAKSVCTWSVAGNVLPADSNNQYHYDFSAAGNYSVCLQVSDTVNFCNYNVCKNVSIGCTDSIGFVRDSNNQYTFSSIPVNQGSGSATYVWTLNNDTITGDSLNAATCEFTLDSTGTYFICVHINDTALHCSSHACDTISHLNNLYQPLLDTINIWHYRGNNVPYLPNQDNSESRGWGWDGVLHYTGNDTLISGKTYRALWETSNWYIGSSPIYLKGFIREDNLERRVYFLPKEDSLEIVLYDFSLHVGDSIERIFSPNGSYYKNGMYVVDSIKLFTKPVSQPRKEFYLSRKADPFAHRLIWVEGIGSLGNLLYPYYHEEGYSFYSDCGTWSNPFPYDYYMFLICYEHNYHVYYDECARALSEAAWPCVEYYDTCYYGGFCGSIDKISSLGSFTIVPVPASSNATLNLEVKHADHFSVVVKTLDGREVIAENDLGWLAEGLHYIPVPLNCLNDGLYLVGCKTKDGTVYRKLIVQH